MFKKPRRAPSPWGPMLTRRQALHCGLLSAAGLAVFAFHAPLWGLIGAMALVGLCVGAASTAAYTAAGAVIPPSVHATGFAFLTSASLAGLALSPVIAGLVGAQSIRVVFIGGVLTLVVLAVLVRRVMVERAPTDRTIQESEF